MSSYNFFFWYILIIGFIQLTFSLIYYFTKVLSMNKTYLGVLDKVHNYISVKTKFLPFKIKITRIKYLYHKSYKLQDKADEFEEKANKLWEKERK